MINLSGRGDRLPLTPEQKEALFASLPRSRKDVAALLHDVAKEGAEYFRAEEAVAAPATEAKAATLAGTLAAALPEDYAARLQVLKEASSLTRNELVISVLTALDTYLATHEPQESQKIKDLVERRKDLVRQKRELAEEVSNAFEQLGFTLCCPSGQQGSLKVTSDETNTKGQFRLIPRGTGQAEKVRANLRDLLPYLRFEGADAHLEPSENPGGEQEPRRPGGRGR